MGSKKKRVLMPWPEPPPRPEPPAVLTPEAPVAAEPGPSYVDADAIRRSELINHYQLAEDWGHRLRILANKAGLQPVALLEKLIKSEWIRSGAGRDLR